MLSKIFRRDRDLEGQTPTVRGQPARIPAGLRVYAIGDVHGRADLLVEIERRIVEDAIASARRVDKIVVYMGDYVDRGLESRAVLDHLIANPMAGFHSVHLLGNHDLWLREFVDDLTNGPSWIRFGGDTTLLSYGVAMPLELAEDDRLEVVQRQLATALPTKHRVFLDGLEPGFGLGDYFFAHAGIRPNAPLGAQELDDLLWIREPFLSWRGDYEKVVVHGHTVEDAPIVRRHRIGIDTGAVWTNRLTCLVLEGTSFRFLST